MNPSASSLKISSSGCVAADCASISIRTLKEARDILVADFVNGTKNTMQGTAKPVVVPQLAGHDSSWFLLCTNRPVKPLIYQQRKKAKFVSKTQETDENVFMKKQFLYGADSRGNAGFGFWQMAFGSDGTGAAG